jgi:predicted acetyltransferase
VSGFTFRPAARDDAPQLAANSLRAYPNGSSGLSTRIERYLDGPLPLEQVFVAERDGLVAGQARTIELRGWFGGVETTVGGLAGVAVAPEARRAGVAAALVRHHVAQLRDARIPWAMLYPFAPSFYASLGWAPAARRLQWRFAPSAMPLFDERRRVRRLDPRRDHEELLAAYHRHCATVNGSLSRTERLSRWEWERSKDQRFAVGVGEGELEGYIFYEAHAPTPRPQTLFVTEWVARDASVERALFGFIAAQADQFEVAILDTPVEHPLAALLDRSLPDREDDEMPPEHHPIATLYSGAMVRVIDLAGALGGRGYPGGPGVAAVEITQDTLVPENRRVLTVTVENGGVRVTDGRAAGASLVQGPVGPISAILAGAVRLVDAERHGLCRVFGDTAALDRLFALPVPYPLAVF